MAARGVLLDERIPSKRVSEWQPCPVGRDRIAAWESWAEAGFSVADALMLSEHGPFVGGGAVETGQVVLQNVPVAPYVINAPQFFASTEPNFFAAASSPAFSAGAAFGPIVMPAVGIYAKLVLQFVGTITQTTASGTTTAAYPYDLLPTINFTANGQDNLFSSSGMALKQLEAARYPYTRSGSFSATTDGQTQGDAVGPGIGGGLTIPTGTTNLTLTWEIPFNMDEASMVGSVFAQARTLSMMVSGQQANVAHLVTNTSGTTVIAGTFSIGVKTYSIPVDGQGQGAHLVIPDLRFLHGFNANPQQIAGLGQVRTTMNRVDGSLMRIFVQDFQTFTDPIAFYVPTGAVNNPSAGSAAISSYQLQFAGNKNPWNFSPAQYLVAQNARDYGAPLPYAGVVLDFARYNAVRDGINLAGVTELYWITNIQTGITAPSNGFQVVTQETLFR